LKNHVNLGLSLEGLSKEEQMGLEGVRNNNEAY